MTGVRLHHSNRLEVLAAELARLMRTDPGDPFAPERIVVPHPTIGRWLSLELARGLGISANVRFEQPAAFAWSLMRAVVPDLPREQPYMPARLRWRLHDLLPGSDEELEGGSPRGRTVSGSPGSSDPGGGARGWEGAVRGYLRDGDPRKRLDLADRLARVFDQCLLYRKDWILEWERGEAPHWQARLWRHLVETDVRDGACHWVRALERFTESFRKGYLDRNRESLASDTHSVRSSAPPSSDRVSTALPRSHPSDPSPAAEGSPRPPGWPRRACLFAVPALSPSYLELLCEAARGIELHLFLLNPCREYWGDIHSRREIEYRVEGADPDERYFSQGNELLAAWGRAGRDSFDALVEIQGAGWEECFVTPAGADRLAAVQRDILDLHLADEAARNGAVIAGGSGDEYPDAGAPADSTGVGTREAGAPADSTGEATREAGAPADSAGEGNREAEPRHGQAPAVDDSIQIHVCHSPIREAEVLHDRLLAVFDTHPDLEPADVLVLTPDLRIYGPAIEAVFAAAGRVPCNVARARASESRTLRAFLDLLSLPASRHGAEPVLSPLAAPAIRARFGIGEPDVAVIRGWVREAGIRWGVDEAHRGEEDLPPTADHTWRHGLRRLVLGYAVANADEPIGGLVPCRASEGTFDGGEMNGELLGRFVTYCEKVFGLRARLGGRRRTMQWSGVLRGVVRDFLADGTEPVRGGGKAGGSEGWALARELADEAAVVRALIRDFESEAADAESPVPIEVVLDVLRERARDTAHEAARLADGVTVTSLVAGGIFPAGVVCTVGMNDGVFPRSPSLPSFDPVAAGRARHGDRDIRHEDRFAFLEALLAARRCFVVTCTGRGLRDDSPKPPSVLVDELKDYLHRRFPGEAIETRHPLQPFSPRYFEAPTAHTRDGVAGEGLFSYSRGMCDAAKVMRAGTTAEPPSRFAGVTLPEPDDSRRRVDLSELVAFFTNPARFFLRVRLGVRLELDDPVLEDEEPFELGDLERYRLRSDIWDQMRAGIDPARGAALLHGSGRLPQAGLGRIVHEQARGDVEPLERLLARYRSALDAPPRPIDFELGEFRVVGAVEHVEPLVEGQGGSEWSGSEWAETDAATMVWWRTGRLRAQDRIEVWLRQLAWAAAGHGPLEAVVISRERDSWKPATFPPPDDARERLGHWLGAWWQGLAAPLPVFPETSMAFASVIARAPDDDDAMPEAREKSLVAWFGDQYRRGERDDPYLALVHDTGDPLTGEFEDLATRLLVPLARTQR